jgi:hypothetical protein
MTGASRHVCQVDLRADLERTGFNCRVSGNNGGAISNAKAPLYWAANGIQLPNSRPQYNADLPDGAQQLQITGSGAIQGNANSSANLNAVPASSSNDDTSSNEQNANSPSPSSNSSSSSGSSPKAGSGRCKSGAR